MSEKGRNPEDGEVAQDEEPFRRIQPHRNVLRDIQQMRDNLDELETIVKDAEWLALGGRGYFDVERADRLCEGIESSMPHIQDSIHELPQRDGGSDDE